MKRFFKYWIVPITIFLFLFVFTVSLLPVLVNVGKYSGVIEDQLSEATGRTVKLGSDISMSFFPWLSLAVSDVTIGNPNGFRTDYFAKFTTFEARVKLLSLLKGNLHFSRFVVDGLDLNLEKSKAGEVNWNFDKDSAPGGGSLTQQGDTFWRLPPTISMSLFAVTGGKVRWRDRSSEVAHDVEDLMILLSDHSLKGVTAVDGKGVFDGKTVVFVGSLAPKFSYNSCDLETIDMAVTALEQINFQVTGSVKNLFSDPNYNFEVYFPSFSPEVLFSSSGSPFFFSNKGLRNIDDLQIKADVKGKLNQINVENGTASFDKSEVGFSFSYNKTLTSTLKLSATGNFLQLDDYLPEKSFKEIGQEARLFDKLAGNPSSNENHSLNVSGSVKFEELRVGSLSFKNITFPITSDDTALFGFDPITFDFYEGRATAGLTLDRSANKSKSRLVVQAEKVQADRFIQDFLQTNSITGNLSGTVTLESLGSDLDSLLINLTGHGALRFENGEIDASHLKRLFDDTKTSALEGERDISSQAVSYSEINSEITIRERLLDTRKTTLTLDSGEMLLTGTMSLVNKNFALQIQAPQPTAGMQNEKPVKPVQPVMISGTFNGTREVQIDTQISPSNSLDQSKNEDLKTLVDEKIPSPEDEDVKDLEGKALIAPEVVAQRFRLQPEVLPRKKEKKHRQLGSGKVHINDLVEKSSL